MRLESEGYSFTIKSGVLLVRDVPYVDEAGDVQWGALMCTLENDGNSTIAPSDHTMKFAGSIPHDSKGSSMVGQLVAGPHDEKIAGYHFRHNLSRKPVDGKYSDFYQKVTTYCSFICKPATSIDPNATPRSGKPVPTEEDEEEAFNYYDMNAARSHVVSLSDVFRPLCVGIVGLGGTGSYILDLLSKCPLREIRLFDGDTMRSHNAFRAPGAVPIDVLRAQVPKVEYLATLYSQIKKNIVAIPEYVSEANVKELLDLDFVFVSMDSGPGKKVVVDKLVDAQIPFVDSGVGLYQTGTNLAGQVRVTMVAPNTPQSVIDRIPVTTGVEDDLYATNIQVAEANILAATLSVLAWKQYIGYYNSLEKAPQSIFVIDGTAIIHSGGQDE